MTASSEGHPARPTILPGKVLGLFYLLSVLVQKNLIEVSRVRPRVEAEGDGPGACQWCSENSYKTHN